MDNTETTPENENAESGTTQEFVPIPDSTDEELDSYLADVEAGVYEEAEENDLESEHETDKPEPEQPEAEAKTEERKEAPQAEAQPEVDRIAKMQRDLEQKERFIKTQNGKLGQTRQQLREALDKLAVYEKEQGDVLSPVDAARLAKDQDALRQGIKDIDAEVEGNERRLETQRILTAHLNPEEADDNDMAASLRADGHDEEFIQNAVRGKENLPPEFVVMWHHRARAESHIRQILPAWKKDREAIKSLKEENERLKKSRSPESVLSNLQTALRKPPGITAAAQNGGTRGIRGGSLTRQQIAKLSDAELDELIESDRRNSRR